MDARTAPMAAEAEVALIAAALRQPDVLDEVDVSPSDFAMAAPRLLWQAALRLRDASQPVDIVTVIEALPQDTLADMGGLAAFKSIAESPASPSNASAYARLVKDKAQARRIIAALEGGTAAAYEGDAQDVAAATARHLDTLLAGQDAGGPVPAAQAVDATLEAIRAIMRGEPRKVTPTGYLDVDKLLGGGLEPGQLALLGARPGNGKSAMAAAIAAHVAQRHGQPALFVSLEMPAEQIVVRLASAASNVNVLKARIGRLAPEEYRRLEDAALELAKAPLFLDYSPAITLSQLAARARKLKREQGGLGVLILDYLQLMFGEPGTRADSRHLELSHLSRGLKVLAGELEVPVIALSQLSRGAVTRDRPAIYDLRDSGGLEADADVVALLWKSEKQGEETNGELILAKQRNGPTGTVLLHWDGPCACYRDAPGAALIDELQSLPDTALAIVREAGSVQYHTLTDKLMRTMNIHRKVAEQAIDELQKDGRLVTIQNGIASFLTLPEDAAQPWQG